MHSINDCYLGSFGNWIQSDTTEPEERGAIFIQSTSEHGEGIFSIGKSLIILLQSVNVDQVLG